MSEYEKKQLELLEAQNKKLKNIDTNLIIIIGLLGAIIGYLVLLYFKRSDN
jgi:hypothetical protein